MQFRSSRISRIPNALPSAAFLLALAVPCLGQVVLGTSTTPASATIGSTVTLSGTGYPSGTIANTAVTVTITPPAGAGGPVTTASTGVVAVGTSRVVSFKIPSSLIVNAPTLCAVSVSGAATTSSASNPFATATPSKITINPVAVVSGVSPGAATRGTAVNVSISGTYTNFQATSTIGAMAGVTVSNVHQVSPKLLTATFTLDPAATPGARNVLVTSGSETTTVTTAGTFLVGASAGLSFSSITPNSGRQGQTLDVTVTGVNTHFDNTTYANFGDGVHVNSLSTLTATSLRANVSVDSITYTGWRMVTAVTGGEFAISGTQGFNVAASAAALTSITPATAAQSASLHVTIRGTGTNFLQNASLPALGSGINIGNVVVANATTLDADIAVGPTATVGAHDLTVTTGGEIVTLPAAFTVTSSTPFLSGVTPTTGVQGTSLALTITGVNTRFVAGGTVTADFGSNITSSVTANSDTSLTVNISIGQLANTGARTVLLHSNNTDFPFSFSVTPSSAQITSLSPTSGPLGGTASVTVTGSNTHWFQGTTTASVYCCGPTSYLLTVNRVTINSPTSAVVDLTIPASAPVTGYTFSMATGGEVVNSSFSVFNNLPSLSISPGSGMIGTRTFVNLAGQFTNFNATTTLNISGQGVTISGYNAANNTPASAMASFVIDPSAPLGPRTVTMTSTVGTTVEIVTTTFVVTSTPAVLTSISPYHSPRSNTLTVTITGQNTHFDSSTTVGFGPNVTINSKTINSATQITASITVDNAAAYGWRTCFVNTGSEQLQVGFRIDSPASPAITGVTPNLGGGALASGLQGQTIFGVTIAGAYTHWVQPTVGVTGSGTQLILGAGVTIANLVVSSPTSMTADIVISPTAPVGGNVLVAITGNEVASGTGVYVAKGTSQILSVTPTVLTQNQTTTVTLVGQATHWLQGGTVADFGSGISVDVLTIRDATHATAQLTVLSQAATGLRTVSLNTDGEAAAINQGVDVQQNTPTLLSSTPNSALQGEVKTIQVLGRQTHWVQGTTTASYSSGITVNSVTVVDAVTVNLNVTVNPTAYTDAPYYNPCRSLTLTTGTEQVSLASQLCVYPGPAQITAVTPTATTQGSTITVHVTGSNTHFAPGATTADFGSGVNPSAVRVTSATTADVDLAVTVNAPTGFHTATLSTLGENATLSNAFTVNPGVPTLNGVSPVSGLQGTTLTVHIIGQFTHWVQGTTTATLGQGITLNSLTIGSDKMSADANITIDPLAYPGSRQFTLTTGSEIVSGTFFNVQPGGAIISAISPSTGNQGQQKLITITGQGTHWSQGLSQFSMSGNVTVNGFVVNSATSATADISISPTAGLGAQSLYITTAGESAADYGAFVITGGIPSITYLSPSGGYQGDSSFNVTINGVFTHWTSSSCPVDFGPGVTVASCTANSDTSITAVVNIGATATPGYNTVTVRTGSQTLTGSFLISQLPVTGQRTPPPYISWFQPSVGVPGQTFTITINGQYTAWDLTTGINFGTGIHVNNFQVVTQTTARANITIDPSATGGSRTVTLTTTTNGEVETASFNVVIATPYISIIDPGSALQGETGATINVVGQYTAWDGTTSFNFGTGVTVNSVTVQGPTIATVNVAVAQLATLGGRGVTATTGTHVDSGCCFSVSPSLANVSSVSPNTALQNDTPTVTVVGQFTHWAQGTTSFAFSGFGISVTRTVVTDSTHATLTLALAPLATLGTHSLTATVGGEISTLNNAFVVQPGTPLILSSAPATIQQQNTLNLTVIGQFVNWTQAATSLSFGANSGISVGTTTVTADGLGITASISAAPTAFIGYRTLYVTTGSQILILANAIQIVAGPAAVTQTTPASGPQGANGLNVAIVGTNTNFQNGITTASFGVGIGVNTLTVTDATHATANINISAGATPGYATIRMSTLGETAIGTSLFLVNAATPVLLTVSPSSGSQGDTGLGIGIVGVFTHFQQGKTTADFGNGITGTVTVTDATHATVTASISPIAVVGTRQINLITDLGGGQQEIAFWSNHTFALNAGPAAISQVAPATGRQNQTALQVTITGTATHFDNTTTVTFGQGITPTSVSATNATTLVATVNIDPAATLGSRTIAVTTGGEILSLAGNFSVTAGQPTITTLSPATAHQGDTLDVQVTALYTNFQQATTSLSFGAGVTINGNITVTDATHARANITVANGATVGSNTVTATTGSEVASAVGAFTIQAGIPVLTTLSPSSARQTSSQTVVINGQFTNFVQGSSVVSFSGAGVTFGTVTVNGPTTLSVPVTVAPGATTGARSVTVTTGSQVVTSVGAFTILPGLDLISQISPNTAVPSQVVPVTITGQATAWVQGTTVASFGPDIQVGGAAAGALGPVTVTSATTLTATLTIPANAPLGPRTVNVQTGGQSEQVINGFTIQLNDTTAPTIVSTSPAYGATSVPLNTAISVTFSKPINAASLVTTATTTNSPGAIDLYLYDTTTGQYIGGAMSLDASGRIGTFVPAQLLAVNRQYQFYLNGGSTPGVADTVSPTANRLQSYSLYFTTGLTTDTTGPTLITTNLVNGDTGIPLNAPVMLQFDKPVNPVTQTNGITVQSGSPATSVPGTYTFGSGNTTVTFTPTNGFVPNTIYRVSYTAQLTDAPGNALTNPGSFVFTTGTANDSSSSPTVISTNPGGTVTGVGTNVSIRARFSKPINPISVNSSYFYLVNNNTGIVSPATVSVSADRLTATLTPNAPLTPYTQYRYLLYNYMDLVGNTGNWIYATGCSTYCYFTTGAGPDTAVPSVTTISPTDAITGVAVNAKVVAVLSQPIDATSVDNTAIQLTPAVPGTVSLSSDQVTLTLTPTSALSASTTYSVQVGGFRGVNGASATAFHSTFATRSLATADTTPATVTSYAPANGSTQPTNTTITFSTDKPLNPTSVVMNPDTYYLESLRVHTAVNGVDVPVAGTVSVVNTASSSVVTFTPSAALTAGSTINVWVCYYRCPTDFAGNQINGVSWSFTVAGAADTTPPTVTSVTPPTGTTGVGQNTPVTITFSKPLNPNTVNGNTFALFNGATQISASINRSVDGRTVTLSSSLASSALITVVVTKDVTDLVGNHVTDYRSQFNTAATPPTGHPNVVTSRPGYGATGVDPASPITLIADTPMLTSTVAGALHISQNGVIVSGSLQFSANNRTVVFTPGTPFTPGALIQVFFDTTATDVYGNSLNYYTGQFTVATSLTGVGPTVSAFSPSYGTISFSNPVVDIQFTKPLDPSTVNASTFFLRQNDSVPVNATVSMLSSNVVRIKPDAPLPQGSYYYRINIQASVKDTQGNAYTGPTSSYYFYTATTTTTDTANPTVTSLAPPDGSTNVGDNALFRIQFNKPIDPLTVNQNTIRISGGTYTAMPSSITFDQYNQTVTITPQTPLPDNTAMTITINGVTDPSGNSVVPVTSHFTTAAGPDTTAPTVLSSSISSGATNVPLNSVFTVVFSEPMDTRLLSGTNFYLYDNSYGIYLPTSISFSPDGTVGTINSTSPLPVGRTLSIGVQNGEDITGNRMVGFGLSFTTSFASDTVAPTVTNVSPFPGATAVPINTQIQVQFSEPVQKTSLGQVTLTGSTLSTTPSLSNGDQVLTLTPNTLLQANTTYTITIAGVKDTSGNTMSGTVTRTFTTGTGADLLGSPTVISTNPGGTVTGVGTNVSIRARFSKPINPISVNSSYFYLVNNNTGIVSPATVSVSADRLTATLTPNAPLTPYTQYRYLLYNYMDLVGNTGNWIYATGCSTYCYFTTGAGPDTAVPSVTTISPTDAITGVAVNAKVVAVLSQPIDATSVDNTAIQLTPAVPGTVSLSSDQVTLTLTPTSALSASTTYSVQVGGFRGVNGASATAFHSTFATRSLATADTTPATVTSYAPANGSTQPTNTTITFSTDKPLNPTSVVMNPDTYYLESLRVHTAVNGVDVPVAGTVSVVNTASSSVVTFTPSAALTAGSTINVWVCYYRCPTDFAGNQINGVSWSFTVAGAADTTPPTVTSVTPPTGTTGVGQNTPVTITFSKPLNPNTVNGNTFALFNGATRVGTNVYRSADGRSVTMTASLNPATVITAAITTGVTDLAGNQLASFSSQFTTASNPVSGSFSVVTQRPGNGASDVATNTPIYLITNRALNASTVSGAMHVSQNGVIVPGTVTVSANGQAILFSPFSNLANNATVQVFLDNTATDTYGNPVYAYSGSFRTVADLTGVGPTLSSISPAPSTIYVTNPVVDIQFTKPVAASAANATNFYLTRYDSGDPIPATVSQPTPNVVRIRPTSALDPTGNPYYRIHVTSAATDTAGNAYTGSTAPSYFYVASTATTDTNTPTVTAVAPPEGATAGDNAVIHLTFSKPMDPLSINANTVTVNNGVVPATFSFDGTNTSVYVTPLAPLPDSTNLTLTLSGGSNGILDISGNPLTTQSVHFSTTNGPDYSQPFVVGSSIDEGLTVPSNAVFTLQFNKSMDTQTLALQGNFYLYDNSVGYVPVSRSFSADGTIATINPTAPLTPGHSFYLRANNAQDLSGNTLVTYHTNFYVSAFPDTAPPSVLATNPGNGQSGVPINTQLQVLFDRPVQPGSISQVTLTGGPALTLTRSLTNGDQTLMLVPNATLAPNTTYTLTIQSVKSISGVAMASTVVVTFTTGTAAALVNPTVTANTPPDGTTGVAISFAPTVTFSSAVNPVTAYQYITLRSRNTNIQVPATYTYSADYKTLTITPTSPLAAATQYTLTVGGSNVTDQAGNPIQTGTVVYGFTTQ